MAFPPPTYTTISGTIIRETEAAVLFKVNGTSHWFPLSQVLEIPRDCNDSGCGSDYYDQIKVADWLLVKKGISL